MSPYTVTVLQTRELILRVEKAESHQHAVDLAIDYVQGPVDGHGVELLDDRQTGKVQVVVKQGEFN